MTDSRSLDDSGLNDVGLSDAGERRREAMRAGLRREVRRRGSRRRALRGAAVLMLLGAIGTIALVRTRPAISAIDRQPRIVADASDRSQNPQTIARPTVREGASPSRNNAPPALGPLAPSTIASAGRQGLVRHIQTDWDVADRIVTDASARLAEPLGGRDAGASGSIITRRIGDEELLDLLRRAGKPSGIVRAGGRVRVVAHERGDVSAGGAGTSPAGGIG